MKELMKESWRKTEKSLKNPPGIPSKKKKKLGKGNEDPIGIPDKFLEESQKVFLSKSWKKSLVEFQKDLLQEFHQQVINWYTPKRARTTHFNFSSAKTHG